MQPMKPVEREQVLRGNPAAAPADLEEYEQLLAERFTADPSLVPAPAPATSGIAGPTATEAREARLAELYKKLFQP